MKRWEVLPDQVTVDGPEEEVARSRCWQGRSLSMKRWGMWCVRRSFEPGVLGVQVVDLHEAEVRVEIAAPLLDRAVEGVKVVVKSETLHWPPRSRCASRDLSIRSTGSRQLTCVRYWTLRSCDASVEMSCGCGLEGLPQGVVRLGPVPAVQLIQRTATQNAKEVAVATVLWNRRGARAGEPLADDRRDGDGAWADADSWAAQVACGASSSARTRRSCYMRPGPLAAGICSAGEMRCCSAPSRRLRSPSSSSRCGLTQGSPISASHNALEDNGIKLFGADGYKFDDDFELSPEQGILNPLPPEQELPLGADVGRIRRLDEALGRYIVFAKTAFPLA